ncbi:MAG: co-chaperone DjlA [Halieaceae bacterium]
MIYGKIVAGSLGLLLGGLPGLLLGVLLGHWFDRGLSHSLGFGSPEQLARMREVFFETSFLLLGHMAKADGRVSEAEVTQAENVMQQLGISGAQRQVAIDLFKRGAASEFDLELTLARFQQECAGPRQIAHTLLIFLISMALADGEMHPGERELLHEVARSLGYADAEFEQLLRMVEAQSHFHDFSGARPAPVSQLADAYLALGVEDSCSDAELKRAYRRRMSEHHPDKLIARGVPEEMLKVATEKAQEIQAAYELIKTTRRRG